MGHIAYAAGTVAAVSAIPMLFGLAFGATNVEAPAVAIFGGRYLYSTWRSFRAIRAVPIKGRVGSFQME